MKTGCSASLVGLHEACRAIQNGDATSAVVAGTSIILTPTISASFTSEGILSPDGSCKTFDAKADGFARAEGVSAIYIKPLEAALREGNPIRAVIKGTGTNCDGRSGGLLRPNADAQEALMRKVYCDNGLDPGETAFVEVSMNLEGGHAAPHALNSNEAITDFSTLRYSVTAQVQLQEIPLRQTRLGMFLVELAEYISALSNPMSAMLKELRA